MVTRSDSARQRTDSDLPGVSYVMPVLNEVGYVETAVRSILEQAYPGETEIVLALGPSVDDTDAIVERLTELDPRIRTVANPRIDIPIGLNLAIKACRNPIIVRVDAHAVLPPGYTHSAVTALLDHDAANVGGIMVAVGEPGFQAAVAKAYNSPLGLGGGAYHRAGAEAGEAESAYLGVMRADALAEVGYFNESVRRGEDWELNFRLRSAGHTVWLDPTLRVNYWPRSTWSALVRQFWATGVWRGELVRRLRGHNSLRFFAPPALVLATGAAIVLVPVAVAGCGAVLTTAVAVSAAGPGAYLALLGVVALREDDAVADRARYALVLASMHYAWGAGFLLGVTRGAKDAVDTSRTG